MFPIRVALFIISLLLVTGAVDAEKGWFIALAVLSGISMFGLSGPPRIYFGGRRWRWLED